MFFYSSGYSVSMRLLLIPLLTCLTLHAKPLNVNVTAKSAILINAETGAILYGKEPNLPCSPASVTKIATTLYVLEKKGHLLDEQVTVPPDAVHYTADAVRQANITKYPPHRLENGGTRMDIVAGETHALKTLIHGMMLLSGNDAANTLATHVSGSVDTFMKELNAFLKQHNIMSTTFHNPHGLFYPDHLTTASDLAKITQLAMKHPYFREVFKTTHYPRPASNKKPESTMVTNNRLLKPGKFYYPHAIGGKTGYIAKAGHCLVASAKKNDRELIAVLLGGATSPDRFEAVINMFNAAFAEVKVSRTLFAKEFDKFSHVINGAKGPLNGVLGEDIKIEYYPSEEPDLKAFLHWNHGSLPIAQGQEVGELRLLLTDGKIMKSYPIFATQALEKTTWAKIKGAVGGLFGFWGILMVLIISLASSVILIYKKHRLVAEK